MNFATLLSQLLTQLQLPTKTPSHLQHLVIRVQRAKSQAELSQGAEGLELLVRLRGRLDDLEQGLAELEGSDVEGERKWSELRKETQRTKESLETELKFATSKIANAISNSSTSVANGRHSRSSSIDLPRRLPSTQQAPSPTPDLDAFLSRLNSQPSPSSFQPSLASRAQQRAKILSEAYSLFLLCTSPSTILPPDQTISSIFRTAASRPPTPSVSTSLESRLSTQVNKAYFDDLATKLSSSTSPKEKGTAWQRICRDLGDACLPLIPSRLGGGSVKRQIEFLLSPKPQEETEEWTIRQSFETLRLLLEVLQKLCAPARDAQVSTLVSDCLYSDDGDTTRELVEVVRETLKLADEMQGDLERFRSSTKVASASDEEVSEVLREEAGERERKAIRGIVRGEIGRADKIDEEIRSRTKAWATRKRGGGDGEDTERLTKEAITEALVDSLFEDQAVVPTPIPDASSESLSTSPSSNSLPPIFWATSPRLFEIQNHFQALTILACLITIIPFHTSPTPTLSSNPDQPDLLSRLWTILKSEITSPTSATTYESTPTRLAHLSDELIAHRQSLLPDSTKEIGVEEKERIRNSTDRILRDQDPVFKLLRKRLREGIKTSLIDALQQRGEGGKVSSQVPANLKTGRNLTSPRSRDAKLPSLYDSDTRSTLADHVELQPIKGYERLMDRVDETVKGRFTEVWNWVEVVWGDVLN